MNEIIKDLAGFIRYKARSESVVGGHWALNQDDLESEAYLLVIGLRDHYKAKSYDEFLKLCRTSIVNHFTDLKGKYLKSNRKNDHYAISFDDVALTAFYGTPLLFSDVLSFTKTSIFPMVINALSDSVYTSSQEPSTNGVFELYEHLSDYDQSILDCLLGRNSRVPAYLHLVMLRSEFVGSQKPIRINEYIIARALCSSKDDVKEGFGRIKRAIERNMNG